MKQKPEWADLPYLTKKQVAEIMQVSPRFIERMVKSGRLRMLKVSSRLVRFSASDIDAFMAAGGSLPKKVCRPIGKPIRRERRRVFRMSGPTGLEVEIVLGSSVHRPERLILGKPVTVIPTGDSLGKRPN